MEEIAKHSDVGASTCERWWNCPGSIALSKKAPPPETSRAAAEGMVAHKIADWALKLLRRGREPDIYSQIGRTKLIEDHEIEIDEEMVDGIIVYLKAISEDASRYGTNFSFLSIEEKFKLDIDKEAWGRNDASLYKPFDTLYVYDLKFGKGIVIEVKDNKQLMYYALGAMQGKDIANVELCIVQPRAYHPDGPVRRFTYSIAELLTFKEWLYVAILNTRRDNAPRKAGDHCKFCPAITICPEVRKEVHEVAKRDFKEVSTLPIETMVKLTELQPRITDFLKEVSKHLQSKAEKGAAVPGFKLVKAKTNRQWKCEQYVINDFSKRFGDLMVSKPKLLSPSQMEKKCKELLKEDELLPYIEKPDGGLVLVKDEDPRQAVKSSAVEDFKDI